MGISQNHLEKTLSEKVLKNSQVLGVSILQIQKL